jgi:hypothetical protein
MGSVLLEIVLRDEDVVPTVELLTGPRVRLTMSASESINDSITFCRQQLHDAVETGLWSLHENSEAPGRVFIRDAEGNEVITTVDPCTNYGSEAIVRA